MSRYDENEWKVVTEGLIIGFILGAAFLLLAGLCSYLVRL
jgi:hypothetical protein